MVGGRGSACGRRPWWCRLELGEEEARLVTAVGSGISTNTSRVMWIKAEAWLAHSIEHLVCVPVVKDRRPQLGEGQRC
jgi:hypothetical protein